LGEKTALFISKGFPFVIKAGRVSSYTELKMKVVLYQRVSTDKQAQSGLGLEAQNEALTALCARQGYQIVSTHTDEGVSGKTSLQDRPELLEAIASIKGSGAQALLVAKLDRLSRDVLVLLTMERTLASVGARLLSASGEGTEDDSPQGKLVKTILAAVAENEAAMVSVRTKAAMKAAKTQGKHIGRPPMGMEKNEWGEWEAGQEFYLVVQILMARYRKKMTYQAVADWMSENTEGRSFTYAHIYRTCKRWGRMTDWYRPYKELTDIQRGMENPAWLQDYDKAPKL
jgi:DNA invertase Pin-like site-specific DNA recombinase